MKRNTIQRKLILETVQKMQNHPTADQVYQRIHEDHPHISRGTVYRNLNALAESGEIALREIFGAANHYDHCSKEHYHVRCLKCGDIFDVDMELVPDLEDKIPDDHGFQFLGYDIIFKGICSKCQEK